MAHMPGVVVELGGEVMMDRRDELWRLGVIGDFRAVGQLPIAVFDLAGRGRPQFSQPRHGVPVNPGRAGKIALAEVLSERAQMVANQADLFTSVGPLGDHPLDTALGIGGEFVKGLFQGEGHDRAATFGHGVEAGGVLGGDLGRGQTEQQGDEAMHGAGFLKEHE